ncbi:MAG TPA: methyltransferase [Candidatus Limiplasma sp.]|nr:methyltransferase [Candidatus Limiplasma sp.]
MPDHYFTPLPQSEHKPASYAFTYRGCALTFETDSGVFSRLEMDKGTETLLGALPTSVAGRVLDMGCGYGALGVCLARANPDCVLTMVDINERAVSLARENAKRNGVAAETLVSDGYAALAGRVFDLIVTNPPIRAGKRVIYRMFADGAAALAEGGAMVLVIRKQQGAPSAKAYLETLFKRVQVTDRSGGFWVLRCEQPQAARVGESDTDE